MKSFFGLLLVALLLAGTGSASAQYPDKAVTCIVPFAPGGAADRRSLYIPAAIFQRSPRKNVELVFW